MLLSIFAVVLFLLGLLSINPELRRLLTPIGIGGLVAANLSVAFSSDALNTSLAADGVGFLRLACAFVSGFIAGLPLALVFHSISVFGRVIDLSAGLLIAEQLQPGMQERQSPSQSLLILGASALLFTPELFSTFGVNLCLARLPQSIPVLNLNGIFLLVGESLWGGVSFALPVVGLLFILELGATLFGRFLQPVNIASELPPTKLILVIAFLVVCGGPLIGHSVEGLARFYWEVSSFHVQR